jgi:5-methylcytosine-specific restriction endonuclease McrBC regulatory subunit McrC
MINEKKKETVADFLKRGGKIKKVKAGTGKEGKKRMTDFKKSFKKTKDKEAELDAKDKAERERNEAYQMNSYVNTLSMDRSKNLWAEAAKDGVDPEPVSGKKTFTKKTQEKVVINPIEKADSKR